MLGTYVYVFIGARCTTDMRTLLDPACFWFIYLYIYAFGVIM